MLHTNSNKARANIRDYITAHYEPFGGCAHCEVAASAAEDPTAAQDFADIAGDILHTFRHEGRKASRRIGEAAAFVEWCRWLPDVFDAVHCYRSSALDELGAILEATPEEMAQYIDEGHAAALLSALIYNELTHAADGRSSSAAAPIMTPETLRALTIPHAYDFTINNANQIDGVVIYDAPAIPALDVLAERDLWEIPAAAFPPVLVDRDKLAGGRYQYRLYVRPSWFGPLGWRVD